MQKIVVGILAFLLMLFPNWKSVRFQYLTITNNTSIAAPKIIDAVKRKDAAALEAMMCLNIKTNIPDLRGEVGRLLDAIDGDMTEATWESSGSYQGAQQDGRRLTQVILSFHFNTSTGTYFMGMTWETANNFKADEVGIRGIGLLDPDGAVLLIINATEGVGNWHN